MQQRMELRLIGWQRSLCGRGVGRLRRSHGGSGAVRRRRVRSCRAEREQRAGKQATQQPALRHAARDAAALRQRTDAPVRNKLGGAGERGA